MMAATADAVKAGGYAAGHIAAMCKLIGEHLCGDPDTATIGEALDGISHIARRLSDSLLDVREAEELAA